MALQFDSDGIIFWPSNVKPAAIRISLSQPTEVSRGQTGIKYTRNLGYHKHVIEVDYPPMTDSDFRPYYAAALHMRGAHRVAWFELEGDDGKNLIFGFTGNAPSPTLTLDSTGSTGDLTVKLAGFDSNEIEPLPPGTVLTGLGSSFGHIHPIITCTNADSFGVATATLAYPLLDSVGIGSIVNAEPDKILVSMAGNEMNIDVATIKYYGFTATFEFDRNF